MAILDLQELETETPSGPEAGHHNSGASKDCNNHSGLSLLLCG